MLFRSDGNGDKISQVFKVAASISDCQPIVNGSKVVYYASNNNFVNFYSIDAYTGELEKKIHRIAGEQAIWEVENNILTISGERKSGVWGKRVVGWVEGGGGWCGGGGV